MRVIIEARIEGIEGEELRIPLSTIEREGNTQDTIGLSLAEGRGLLASVQAHLVQAQFEAISAFLAKCPDCGKKLSVKGKHPRKLRTLFGCIEVQSPRVRCCGCQGNRAGTSFSPLVKGFPSQMTPELEYLQVKWAAHLPFAAAAKLLTEVLPIDECISATGVRRRVLAFGAALDRPAAGTQTAAAAQPGDTQASIQSLAVDSAWLRHCDPPDRQARHVNIVAGRALFESGKSRLYAYVNNQVPSAANRLDRFLKDNGVRPEERVTILSDGAGEFQKAVEGSTHAVCRILDWFHIAMKFRAIEQSAWKFPDLLAPGGKTVQAEIKSAKWLVWHGKASKAVTRLKAIHDAFGIPPEAPYSPLWWNLRQTYWYLEGNARYLVNYGRRHRKGLPISSAIAESAVNQVVSLRFAKKRQMRWSDEGAHLLAQVRVHALNGDLRPQAVPIPLRDPKPIADPWLDGYRLRQAA